MNATHPKPARAAKPLTFIETALKLAGKSDEEARRTGAVDRADGQVEKLLASDAKRRGALRTKSRLGTICPAIRSWQKERQMRQVDWEYGGQGAAFREFA